MEHLYDTGVVEKPIVIEECTYKLIPSGKTFTQKTTRNGRTETRQRCSAYKGFLKKCRETEASYRRRTSYYVEDQSSEEESDTSSDDNSEESSDPSSPITRRYPGGSVTWNKDGTVSDSCVYKLSEKGSLFGYSAGRTMSDARNKACREAEKKCRKKKGRFRKCRELSL